MKKTLAFKLGAERLTEISTSQLLVEIEGVSVQKQLDYLNKVKLFDAVKGPSEPIRSFIHRLHTLAYECNFTANCSSQNCTSTRTTKKEDLCMGAVPNTGDRLVSVSGIRLSAVVNSFGLDVKDTHIFFSTAATKARKAWFETEKSNGKLSSSRPWYSPLGWHWQGTQTKDWYKG